MPLLVEGKITWRALLPEEWVELGSVRERLRSVIRGAGHGRRRGALVRMRPQQRAKPPQTETVAR